MGIKEDPPPSLPSASGMTPPGGRRESGVTLLALLHDLGDLLTTAEGDSAGAGTQQHNADLENVGTRVATFLPQLIEECCAKEAPDTSEVTSICRLAKLALTQFPEAVFGSDAITTIFYFLGYFLHLCKSTGDREARQSVASVLVALHEYAASAEPFVLNVLLEAEGNAIDFLAEWDGMADDVPLDVFRDAYSKVSTELIARRAGAGRDDEEEGKIAMHRGEIASRLALKISTRTEAHCMAAAMLSSFACGICMRAATWTPIAGADRRIMNVLTLMHAAPGLLPEACDALLSLFTVSGVHSFPWESTFHAVLLELKSVLWQRGGEGLQHCDQRAANLVMALFGAASEGTRDDPAVVATICFLCAQPGLLRVRHLRNALYRMLLRMCHPRGDEEAAMMESVITLAHKAISSAHYEVLLKMLVQEAKNNTLMADRGDVLNHEREREGENASTSTRSGGARTYKRKRAREGEMGNASWLLESIPSGHESHTAICSELSHMCTEATREEDANACVENAALLTMATAVGKRWFGTTLVLAIEKAVWHMVKTKLEKGRRSKNADGAYLEMLEVVSCFVPESTIPTKTNSDLKNLSSAITLPWSMAHCSDAKKFSALRLAIAMSWNSNRCMHVLETSIKDQNPALRAATVLIAPVLTPKPHCVNLSKYLPQNSKDDCAVVRVAVAHAMAISYMLDFDLEAAEKFALVSKIRLMVRDAPDGMEGLYRCFRALASKRRKLLLKTNHMWKLQNNSMLAKYLLHSEQSEEVQMAFIRGLQFICSHCHSKELKGCGIFLKEILDWILVNNGAHLSGKMHACCYDLLKTVMKDTFLSEMFPSTEKQRCSSSACLQYLRGILKRDNGLASQSLVLQCVSLVGMTLREKEPLLIALVVLVQFLDCRDWGIQALATKGLQRIADAHGIPLASLVCKNPRILEYIVRNLLNKPRLPKIAADALLNCSERALYEVSMPFVIPRLVSLEDTKVLEAIAEAMCADREGGPLKGGDLTPLRKMLLDYGHYAMADIVVAGGDFERFMDYMEKLTDWPFSEHLKASFHKLLMQVLWKASDIDVEWKDHKIPKETFTNLKETLAAIWKASIVHKQQLPGMDGLGKDAFEEGQDVARFLQSGYLTMLLKGIGDHMNRNKNQKVLAIISENEELQAIRCLSILIELSGHYVKEFTPAFMALLSKGLESKDESSKAHAIQGLAYFVDALASVPSLLKRIIEPVVVAILPFLERDQSSSTYLAAVMLMQRLILPHQQHLQKELQRLPFFPSSNHFREINELIMKSKGEMDNSKHMLSIIDSLHHDAISVKYAALGSLKSFLTTKRAWVDDLMTSHKEADIRTLNGLLSTLLKCLASDFKPDRSSDLSMRCLECLGEIGAIDPVRAGSTIQREQNLVSVITSKVSLPATLITKHLSRVLSSTTDLDCLDRTAYAIQQILKTYGQKGVADTASLQSINSISGNAILNELSEEIQTVLKPLLTSKYQLTTTGIERLPSPIIGKPGLTFERWLLLWVRHLIACIPEKSPWKVLFQACSGMLKYDLPTLLFLFPHLVLVIITSGDSDAVESVRAELKAAMAQRADGPDFAGVANGDNGGASKLSHLNERRFEDRKDPVFDLSLQTIFSLLDELEDWLEFNKMNLRSGWHDLNSHGADGPLEVVPTTKIAGKVSGLLRSIPQANLAKSAYHCGAYARALKHYEIFLRNENVCGHNPPAFRGSSDVPDEELSFLIHTYANLEEPDGLDGLAKLRKEGKLSDKILIAEKAGNWAEVLAMHEESLQHLHHSEGKGDHPGYQTKMTGSQRGYLRCLLNMGHHQALITYVGGLNAMGTSDHVTKELANYATSSALRLGRWDLLSQHANMIPSDDSPSYEHGFDARIARLLLEKPGRDKASFRSKLKEARLGLLGPLSAGSMESYTRIYPVLNHLHILQEIEQTYSLMSDIVENDTCPACSMDAETEALQSWIHDQTYWERNLGWEGRLLRTQEHLTVREPILAVRRALMSLWLPSLPAVSAACRRTGGVNDSLGYEKHFPGGVLGRLDVPVRDMVDMFWESPNNILVMQKRYVASQLLEYATLCRKSGYHEAAYIAILKAETFVSYDVSLARSKLLWDMDKPQQAISDLKAALRSDLAPRRLAKKYLYIARWCTATGAQQESRLKKLYEEAITCDTSWEKGYFYYAKYLDKLMCDAQPRDKVDDTGNTSYLSRASRLKHAEAPMKSYEYVPLVIKNYGLAMTHGTKTIYQSMPRMLTIWFDFGSDFVSQRSSSHPIPGKVGKKVFECISNFLKVAPQAVWLAALPQLISRICHPHEEVRKFIEHIISRTLHWYPNQVLWALATISNSNVAARKSAAKKIMVTTRKRANERRKQLFADFEIFSEQLIKLCFHQPKGRARSFSVSQNFRSLERMMPLEVLVPVQNAMTMALPSNGGPFKMNGESPFESSYCVTVTHVFDEVDVLHSLQKPKKLRLLGSDGNEYVFLCKPKDDLRKDTRMMELASVINHLFSLESASRRRQLKLRTFSVVPLTEDCGIIEWVPNTNGFRHCCQDMYVADGLFDRKTTNKDIKETYDRWQGRSYSGLLDKVLSQFPPKLHKWFLSRFPEPSAWLESRLNFSRTAAVWSMVGHIVGLGDRHGENILIDASTGDCVHVDFSCLFDKGLTLEKPEMVPFRLTQNVIDGFGISGYEGVFRISCESTLKVLRSNRETLLNILETFVHDPLVEWTSRHSGGGDFGNPLARDALNNIKSRLDGVVVGVRGTRSLPLSPEGQVDRLIAEATSKDNLGRMYIWWMPWF